MRDVVVYTAIFDDYDSLISPRYPDVPHFCFTDNPRGVAGWEEIKVKPMFNDPKRDSGMYLALSHRWLPDAEYTIYHGGAGELLSHPENLIDILGDADISTFRHPCRDCVYYEAEAVVMLRRDDPQTIRKQMSYYRRTNYPAHNGLMCSAIITRKHNAEVAHFNEMLWGLMCRFSRRDQLAIDYALWCTGIKWTPIPGGASAFGRLAPNHYHVWHGHG